MSDSFSQCPVKIDDVLGTRASVNNVVEVRWKLPVQEASKRRVERDSRDLDCHDKRGVHGLCTLHAQAAWALAA